MVISQGKNAWSANATTPCLNAPSGVGLNEWFGRTFCAISMPPSGLRVEPEDA